MQHARDGWDGGSVPRKEGGEYLGHAENKSVIFFVRPRAEGRL